MTQNAIAEKILAELQSSAYWGDHTKRSDKYITGLNCPECGEPEAYAYSERPDKLYCNRRNNCGAVVDVADILPGARINFEEDFPATAEDKNRPGTTYLQSRGLNKSLEGLDYKYWSDVRKTGSGAVMFPIKSPSGETVYNGRLFDPPDGEGKTHNKGSTSGCVWRHPGFDDDPTKETFVTEGIINALSLIEAGHQAVAILSSNQDPEKVDLSSYKKIVLAFDNDPAGHKALKRFKSYLKGQQHDYIKTILPIHGDWNDLLLNGKLEPLTFEKDRVEYATEAHLACASSAQEYARIWYGHRNLTGLFDFNGAYYFSTLKGNDLKDVVCQQVSDFTLRTVYYELDQSNPDEPVYRYHLEVKAKSGHKATFTVIAKELSSPQGLRTMFLQRGRVSWTGEKAPSNELVKLILNSKAPVVRQLHIFGYDRESDCYIYRDHMIDREGRMVMPDKNGFFKVNSGKYIRPPYHNTLKPSEGTDVHFLIDQLYRAWGYKALVTLAWVVASWFVNQIKDQVGFFPFLSLYKNSQTGKSNLTRIMNLFQCLDEEGIPMSKTNTAKGEIRKMSQRSGLFTALLEWPKDWRQTRLSLGFMLPIYNKNGLQLRALMTNDNRTHETPFYGALMFVQNNEPFNTPP